MVRFGSWTSLGEVRAAYGGSRRAIALHREQERMARYGGTATLSRPTATVSTQSSCLLTDGRGKGCPVNHKVWSLCIWVRWMQILPRVEYPESGRLPIKAGPGSQLKFATCVVRGRATVTYVLSQLFVWDVACLLDLFVWDAALQARGAQLTSCPLQNRVHSLL